MLNDDSDNDSSSDEQSSRITESFTVIANLNIVAAGDIPPHRHLTGEHGKQGETAS